MIILEPLIFSKPNQVGRGNKRYWGTNYNDNFFTLHRILLTIF